MVSSGSSSSGDGGSSSSGDGGSSSSGDGGSSSSGDGGSSSNSIVQEDDEIRVHEEEAVARRVDRFLRWLHGLKGFDSHGLVLQHASCRMEDQQQQRLSGANKGLSGGGLPKASMGGKKGSGFKQQGGSRKKGLGFKTLGAAEGGKAAGLVHGFGTVAGGRGVRKGQVVVTVPRMALMNLETAELCPAVGPLLDESSLSEWQALCLHLLYERQRGKGSFWDPYIKLLPSAADLAETHPLMWREEDRQRWLQGSPSLAAIERQIQLSRENTAAIIRAGANELLPCQQQSGESEGDGEGECCLVTEEAVRWATAILLSRAFSLDLSDSNERPFAPETSPSASSSPTSLPASSSPTSLPASSSPTSLPASSSPTSLPASSSPTSLPASSSPTSLPASSSPSSSSTSPSSSPTANSICLVPWADMLNHSSRAGPESCLVYDPDADVAILSAHQAYRAGQEVFDSYGPWLTPAQLFADYGFVDDGDESGVIDLPASSLALSIRAPNAALLKTIGLPPDASIFSLSSDSLNPTLLAWMRAAMASDDELAAAGWPESSRADVSSDVSDEAWSELAAQAMARFAGQLNETNEMKVLSSLQEAAKKVLAGYPTSLEDDESLLRAALTGAISLPLSRLAAARLTASEKRALLGTLEQTKRLLVCDEKRLR